MTTVMVDIGHYDNDSGAVFNGLREVDFNYKVCTRLIEHLKRCGIEVVTSTGSLNERVKLENKLRPDYFLSVHTNAGGGDGAEVLVYKKDGVQLQIAESIINEIVTNNVNNSRGVKERPDLYVLKHTYAPAVLVEMAFIDTKDIEAIETAEKQDKMAQCIARGLLKAIGVQYVEVGTSKPSTPNTTKPQSDVMYRVCTGSYMDKNNATKEVEKLKSLGIESFIHVCEVSK